MMDKKIVKWIASFVALTVVCIVGSALKSRYDSTTVLQSQGFVPVETKDNDILEEAIEAESAREEKIFKVNLNTATAEELSSATGIGSKVALSIVKFREDYGSFKKVEEIKLVRGIGDKTYSNISKYLTVE